MNERALTFGDERHLVGILTEPAPSGRGGEEGLAEAGGEDLRPGVVFLNSGILHRVGASRIYVKLARRLAAARVPHRYEEFDDTHSGIDYRLDTSLPYLARALDR